MNNNFLYVFIICIILLAVILALTVIFIHHHSTESNDEFLDEEGRHIYYDRSRIEKEEFLQKNPEMSPKEVRSFQRLFHFRLKKGHR